MSSLTRGLYSLAKGSLRTTSSLQSVCKPFSSQSLRGYSKATSTTAAATQNTTATTDVEKSAIPYQFLSISKEQWDKNIGKETLMKELQSHFDRIGANKDRSTLLRQPVFEVIEWLNRMKAQHFVKTQPSDYAILVDGKRGAGKSVTLNQVVFWAKQQGWLVFYVPSCYKFIHTGTLTPFVENPMLFEQHELSTQILTQMMEVNGDMLKQIHLKTSFKIQFNNFKSSSDRTLYDLAASSLNDCSSEVLYHFKRELDCVTEFPVLIALDGYNQFQRVSGYGDMYDARTFMNTLPTSRLLACDLFSPLLNHSLANGVVVASTTDEVSKETLLSQVPEDQVIQVPKFSLYEMRLLLNFLVEIDYLEKVPSQETVQYLWQMSSGNARDVEVLETKLRDTTTGIIPKLKGDDYIKSSEVIDWLVANLPITRTKAADYGQMLWNRGVFDHIAPQPFGDNDQLFRLKQSEISPRKSVDEQQWTQLRQEASNKDISNADPIAKLHKSIENATKVYQRLLREKNQAASPNTLLGLKLLDQTLNLITSNNKPHANFGQILQLLQNTIMDQNESIYIRSSQASKKPVPEIRQAVESSNNNNNNNNYNDEEIDDILAASEKLENGLAEQLNLAHQQTVNLKLLRSNKSNGTTTASTKAANLPVVSTAPVASISSPQIQSNSIFGIDESPISLQRQRSSSHFGSLKGIDLAPVVIGSVENKFPKFCIADPKNDSFIFTINGPSTDQLESSIYACFNNNFYAKTVSTYPHLPNHPKREGDPICDHFCIQMQSTRVIAAVADGCNWGVRPAEAAAKASAAFVEFISKALSTSEIQTVQDAGNHILSAFNYAHNKIIEGKSDIWDSGTTTLLGGVMVELKDSSRDTSNGPLSRSVPITGGPQNLKDLTKSMMSGGVSNARDPNAPPSRWGFICASVGDCKAFHYNHSSKKFTDITKNNRGNVDDPKDPGGRLGPYVANGHPDLRNLCLHFLPCHENDIIILVSDGVHDNLDPQTIGVAPKECQLPHESWSDMEFEKVQENKSKYMQEFLKKKLRSPDNDLEPLSAKMITEKLIEHCVETTRSSREFMVAYPNKPLPDDLKAYPGKMDHTTCVAFKVGKQTL
eukprot:gene8018-9420_t